MKYKYTENELMNLSLEELKELNDFFFGEWKKISAVKKLKEVFKSE